MSSMDFASFHSIYKSLQKLKAIIVSKSIFGSAELLVEDTYDVYVARLQELLTEIAYKSENITLANGDTARLAAMALCLRHDYLKISLNRLAKEPTAANQLEQELLNSESIRFDEFICLIYLKALLLLMKSPSFDSMEQKNQEYWHNIAHEMYTKLSNQCEQMEIYDCDGIFAESKEPIPLQQTQKSTAFNGIIEKLATKLHSIECPSDGDHFADILGHHGCEMLCKQNPIVWVRKLLSLVPHLLQQKNFKCGSYYILTAAKALDLYATDKNMALVTNMRSSIVTFWTEYTFEILNASTGAWIKADNKLFANKSIQNDSKFRCFSKIVTLKPELLQLCIDAPINVSTSRCLVSFSIGLIKQLLKLGDFTDRPLNYIKHVYQLMDLFNVLTYLLNDPNRCYTNQLEKFQHFEQMMQWLSFQHSHLFDVLYSDFVTELDDLIKQLYEANQNRKQSKNSSSF